MKMVLNKKYNYRQLERIVRGFSNHRRIEILKLLEKYPELSVIEISERLNKNFKTIADHVRRLTIAGLLMKKSQGASIRHRLTKRGEKVLEFLRTLE
jgi:DNA-binding transcriptional ArsR family regulator